MSLTTNSKVTGFDRSERTDFIYSIKSQFKDHIKNPSLSDKTFNIDDNIVYADSSMRVKVRVILNDIPFKIKGFNFNEPVKACILSNRDGSCQLVGRIEMLASVLGIKYKFNKVNDSDLLSGQLRLKLFQELPPSPAMPPKPTCHEFEYLSKPILRAGFLKESNMINEIKEQIKQYADHPKASDRYYSTDSREFRNERMHLRLIINPEVEISLPSLSHFRSSNAILLTSLYFTDPMVKEIQQFGQELGLIIALCSKYEILSSRRKAQDFYTKELKIQKNINLEKEEPTYYCEELPDIKAEQFETEEKPYHSDEETETSDANRAGTPFSEGIEVEELVSTQFRSFLSDDPLSDEEHEASDASPSQEEISSSEETLEELVQYIRSNQELVGKPNLVEESELSDDETGLVKRLNNFTFHNSEEEISSSDEEMADRPADEAAIEFLSKLMTAGFDYQAEQGYNLPNPNRNDEDCKIS